MGKDRRHFASRHRRTWDLWLVLALVGLYSLMTHSVNLRQREIGICIAVGSVRGPCFWFTPPLAFSVASLGSIFSLPHSVQPPPCYILRNQAEHFPWRRESNITETKRNPHVPSAQHRTFDRFDSRSVSGDGPSADGNAPDAPDPRSPHARLCHSQ